MDIALFIHYDDKGSLLTGYTNKRSDIWTLVRKLSPVLAVFKLVTDLLTSIQFCLGTWSAKIFKNIDNFIFDQLLRALTHIVQCPNVHGHQCKSLCLVNNAMHVCT